MHETRDQRKRFLIIIFGGGRTSAQQRRAVFIERNDFGLGAAEVNADADALGRQRNLPVVNFLKDLILLRLDQSDSVVISIQMGLR